MTQHGTAPEKMKQEVYALAVQRIRDAFASIGIGYDVARDRLDEVDEDAQSDDEDRDNSQEPTMAGANRRASKLGAYPDGTEMRSRSSLNTSTIMAPRDSLSRSATLKSPKL